VRGFFSDTMILLLALVIVVALIVATGVYVNGRVKKVLEENNTETTPPLTSFELMFLWVKMKFGSLTVKIKIIVATFQVVASTAVVISVAMPDKFSRFANVVNLLNLNFSSLFQFGCAGRYTYFDTVLFTTLSPVAVAVVFVLLLFSEFGYRTLMKSRKPLETLAEKYLVALFYLSYFILPSVTTTVFKLFLCTNIDPNQEDPGNDDYFLTADMSISCQSDLYSKYITFAVAMIVLYPVGIPLMYFTLLYYNRDEIADRDSIISEQSESTTTVDENNNKRSSKNVTRVKVSPNAMSKSGGGEDSVRAAAKIETAGVVYVLSPSAARLSFLWEAYEPRFWYWEIIETTRRIMLTAVLSVLDPGSSGQSIVAVLIALFYIKVYGYFNPYREGSDDILSETGQFQIFFTFFCALIIQNDLLTKLWADTLGVVLTTINFTVVMYVIWFEIRMFYADRKRIENEKFLQSNDGILSLVEESRDRRRTAAQMKAESRFAAAVIRGASRRSVVGPVSQKLLVAVSPEEELEANSPAGDSITTRLDPRLVIFICQLVLNSLLLYCVLKATVQETIVKS
jgi:hypothetical protein